MSKSSYKKKGRSKLTKKTAIVEENGAEKENSDIMRFFLPSPDKKSPIFALEEVSMPPEGVPVPSPDAAALPSQSICIICNYKAKSPISHDGCHCTSKLQMKENSLHDTSANEPLVNHDFRDQKSLIKSNTRKKKKELKNNHLVTEYFPVRRSIRKTRLDVKKEKQQQIAEAILSGKEDGFEVKEFPVKGRGVVTTRKLKRGDFVLEYYGELISMEEARIRETIYSEKENTGCYMYYFKHDNKQYCVDATKESERLGRLVNHSKKGNLKTQSFFIDNSPHLILIASKDISEGEELLYDYGDRSKLSLESHPWLAL